MATTSLSIYEIQGYVNGSTSSYQWFGSDRKSGSYYALRFLVVLPKGKDYSISLSITGRNDYGGSTPMASGKQYNIGIAESHNSTYASGSSSSYNSSFTTTSQIGSGSSYTGTATISYNKTLTSDTGVYIYIWGNNPSSVYSLLTYVSASISVSYTSTTACGAPTSVSASGIITPNGSFTVSWSGASSGTNNSISSYQIYWYISSGGTAPSTYSYSGTKNVQSTSTSGSTTITLSGATRGYKVVCGVVTMGTAGSSYYSSIKTGGSVTINSLPSLSTITQSATNVNSGTSVTFSVSVADSNSSYQTLKYGYKLSTDSNYTYVNSGTKISFTKTSGSYTINFIPYDGLETGAVSSKSFTVNRPSGSITVSANDSIYNTLTYPITKKISCSASYANGANGIKYYYRTNSTSSLSGNGTLIGTSAPTQVPDAVSPGNYYQIGILPYNSLENGNYVWSDIFIKPTAPTAPSSLLINASGFSSLTAFYNNKIDAGWKITASTANKKQSPLIKTYLKYTYGSTSATISNSSITGSPISDTSFSKSNLSLPSSITRGGTVTIEAIVEDAAGQSSSYSTTITRIKEPSFINTTGASISPTSIKPYSINSGQLIFRIPKVISDFEQDIKLEISTTNNSSSKQILTGESLIVQEENTSNSPATSWENESTFKVSFELSSLKDFFINLDSSSISSYSKTFLIRAVDAFGNYSSNNINLSYTLDYREAPVASSSYFKIGVDKSFKFGSINNCNASDIFPGLNTDNTNNYRIINPNEKIIFAYPIFSSNNPNESITLYVQYSYGNNAANIPSSGWNSLVSFSYGSEDNLLSSLCSVNSSSIYNNLRAYSISNTINGFKYVFFRMYAKASSGLVSETSDFDYCLYCSQSNLPTIEIDRLSISEDIITINYKNLIYGGNTNTLKNYERTYSEKEGNYAPSLKIIPILNSDSDFDSSTNINYEIQDSSSINYIEFTSDFNSLNSGEIKVKLLSGTELTRIYIKLNVSVTTGLSSSGTILIKTNDSTLSVFYNRVPTISKRANQIGINTKSFNENDAILIENYEEKQYIRLKGTTDTVGEEDPIIIIDLNSSSISGITIDCGAW